MTKIEEIDKFDFAANFKLKADVGAKIKAGVGAAVEMKALADKLDADLLTACGGLAKDLGDTGTYTNGQDACKAAINVMGTVKAKMGAGVSIKLDIESAEVWRQRRRDGRLRRSLRRERQRPLGRGEVRRRRHAGRLLRAVLRQLFGHRGRCVHGRVQRHLRREHQRHCCDGNCSGKCDGKATPAAPRAASARASAKASARAT